MISSLISIIIAVWISLKIPKNHRYLVCSVLLMFLMPLVSYIIFGAKQVFSSLTVQQILTDTGFILKNCLGEPVNLIRGQATDWQFALPGIIIVGTFVWGIAVLSFNQRRPEPARSH